MLVNCQKIVPPLRTNEMEQEGREENKMFDKRFKMNIYIFHDERFRRKETL